ncbi:cardiolipin synthase [Pararhodobacter marinus]|uniref:cardiolipin synthase n=2 Tax=Pararhodobacter marinus TaxID=2184063 RepID=UPI0035193507
METGALVAITASVHYLLQAGTTVRALTRPGRDPASRLAWVLVILSVPALGVALYLLLGEVSPGRRRALRLRDSRAALPVTAPGIGRSDLPEQGRAAFARAEAVNRFATLPGNEARLLGNSDEAVDALIADIEAARESVHILVYIWLADRNGTRLAEALMRAARRGVTCRAMADGLGSRRLLRSDLWRAMGAAGVKTGIAFDTSWAFARLALGRVDIRNHRKIFVIDGRIAHIGSQNCADAAFLPKAKFAPWVDIMLRVEGPVVWQQQALFAADWMGQGGDDMAALLKHAPPCAPQGFPALVFGTGPDLSPGAVPDVVGLLLAAARDEVVISTPYFVPNPGLVEQLRATAIRGVSVTLILPARNDSRMVGWASRSSWPALLEAGVVIREYRPGLLHAKTFTVDGRLSLIGSANLDRRSFELNFENSLLIADEGATASIRARQAEYVAKAPTVSPESVANWSLPHRLLCNAAAMISPVL